MITQQQLIEDIKTIDDAQSLELVHQLIEQIKQQQKPKKHSKAEQENAMAEFFGLHKELGVETVEEELRSIRKGRRSNLDAI